jgi:hypothetical protein
MNSPLAESVGLTMACLYFAGGRFGTKPNRAPSDRRNDNLSYSPVAVLPLANPKLLNPSQKSSYLGFFRDHSSQKGPALVL